MAWVVRLFKAFCLGLPLVLSGPAFAADAVNPGSVAWVLTASALVLFMTLPGLALFYGGLVQSKNVLSVLMHCFAITCVASLIWTICGYSLAFDGAGALIGGANKLFLARLDAIRIGTELPEAAFALFQMTFAVITPALMIGAFPERVRFSFVLAFSALWLVFVYLPVAHWIWGGGWLAALGAQDFAGGIVVHTTAGVSALLAAMAVGGRRGFPSHLELPHSPGMTMAGAAMLWVGWFGFNGGSALTADAAAASAILATHLAACAAALTWIAVERVRIGKPTSIGIVTGCVAGLATVTPAAGFVGPMGGAMLGVLGGAICFFAVLFIKQRLRIDDSLDVFAVHGVGGMLGSVLLAVFAAPSFGGVGLPNGAGMGAQFLIQLLAVAVTAGWSALATVILVRVLRALTGLRVDGEAEYEGLDLAAHGERAYDLR